jgi:hypothetical protein
MKKLLLILLFIFFSNNVYAFDYCNELKHAIEICRVEVQHEDPGFDAYLEHCVGNNWIYDTVEHYYIPEKKDDIDVRCFSRPYLSFKFTMCLREHHFNIEQKR